MAKKRQNKKTKEEKKEEATTHEECNTCGEKLPLVELVANCPLDETWIIYNLNRKGLMPQFEMELKYWGVRELEPTLTSEEFYKIMVGEL